MKHHIECEVYGPAMQCNNKTEVWVITHSLLLDRVLFQPTSPSTRLWTYFPGVPLITEDTLVLLRTAAPSDCLQFVRLINLHLRYKYISYYQICVWADCYCP